MPPGSGALGQGKAVASAAEAIARNPGATGDIRGALLLGLVLIESLVIYVLLISLLLFFFNPFRNRGNGEVRGRGDRSPQRQRRDRDGCLESLFTPLPLW